MLLLPESLLMLQLWTAGQTYSRDEAEEESTPPLLTIGHEEELAYLNACQGCDLPAVASGLRTPEKAVRRTASRGEREGPRIDFQKMLGYPLFANGVARY